MKIYTRFIYNNFLKPSSLPKYEELIRLFWETGYVTYTHEKANDLLLHGEKLPNKTLLIRHDIDTDPKTAYTIAAIEHKYGFTTTFYFRWCTADRKYIKLILEMGHEVGYHYEEIASYAKKHRLKTKSDVIAHREEIQNDFIYNLKKFRNDFGVPCRTIAAHGEWINNYIKITNCELLDDSLREDLGIALEAYDDRFRSLFTSARYTDLGGGDGIWEPTNPNEAILRKESVVRLLVHPRQWHCGRWWNFKTDFLRLFETIKYRYL